MSVYAETTFSAVANTPARRDDLVRYRIVRLIFLFYWLLIFEGALRKWGLPQLQEAIFFIRVPVALIVYWMAFVHRRWPRTNAFLLSAYLLGVVAALYIPLQFAIGGYSSRYLLLVAYGWMNYFFYIPLAFVIAEQFRAEDLQRLIRHTSWLVIAAAPLVVAQFFSPPDSAINLGTGTEAPNQFVNLQSALGYVRPTGFFTSALGQALFVASATSLLLTAFIQRHKNRRIEPVLLWPGLGAIIVITVMGQSRTMFFLIGLNLAAAAVAGVITGRHAAVLRSAIWPAVLVITAGVLWPLLFPTAFDVFISRWTQATGYESDVFALGTLGRIFYSFYAFMYHIPETPFWGYFLGLGNNAASSLEWVQKPVAAAAWHGYGNWSEDAWSQHIIDLGPLLGLCYIAFRVTLTAWLGITVARATRHSGDIMPTVVFGFLGVTLLLGQIVGQGTTNGYAWFFVGVCLAAARNAMGGFRAAQIERKAAGARGFKY